MSGDLTWGSRYLMTEPKHFTVFYEINPWMTPNVDTAVAQAQWRDLVTAIEEAGASVEVSPDVDGLPDMTFTANAAFVAGDTAVISRFRHAERQPEEPHWRAWFEGAGYKILELAAPPEVRFEAGDAFLVGDELIAGYGFRSDRAGVEALGEAVGRDVHASKLIDPRFYHLDTCFSPFGDGRAIIYPGAFAPEDRDALIARFPRAILLDEEEALTFCSNSILVGDLVISGGAPPRVVAALGDYGFRVHVQDVSEFGKSGGSVRCLTLPIDVPAAERSTQI